jgi:3',5'-cyclic AMP phosphodiesterase CpdA
MKLIIKDHQPFRICQLTDIHIGEFPLNAADRKTLSSLDGFLSTHTFDLIIITGDVIWGKLAVNPVKSLGALFDILNKYPVPVAITYGNHDTEGQFSRKDLRRIEERLKYPAEKHYSQITNDRESYTLEVYDDETLSHILYVWDSGAYSHWPSDEQYAAIEPEQINWFLKLPYNRNENDMDLGFLHIPFPEYDSDELTILDGVKNEAVSSPKTNSGLFYALKRKGNVKAVFAGHDHDNNFVGTLRNLQLSYGNVTGYNTYGSLPRGAREIDIMPHSIKTRILLFDNVNSQ